MMTEKETHHHKDTRHHSNQHTHEHANTNDHNHKHDQKNEECKVNIRIIPSHFYPPFLIIISIYEEYIPWKFMTARL